MAVAATLHMVASLHAWFMQERNKLCLIMELCAGGDLSGHIKRSENRRGIPEAQARQFMQQLAAGLQELWSHNMVHVSSPTPIISSWARKMAACA